MTTTFRYDLIGRTVEMKTSDGQRKNFIYDKFNRLSLSKLLIDKITFNSGYIYGDNTVEGQKAGLIYGVKLNGTQKLAYQYDELSRLKNRTINTITPFVTEYSYLEGTTANTTTTLVKTIKNGNDTLAYSYDELGNITAVSKNGTVTETYTYDSLGQLIGATYGGNTYIYSYDNGGNITEVKKNDVVLKSYTYGNSEWRDLLTTFNGKTITYDDIGNPITYRNGMNFLWESGRQLSQVRCSEGLVSYSYNADGLRTSKTVQGTTTEYYWSDGLLYAQKTGTEYIFFLYDETGKPYGFDITNGTNHNYYYYEFNLQGDIIGIIDINGRKIVQYKYSPWGEVLAISGNQIVALKNPLRYRGYYFDNETGFYYVSSRYYDPEVGRFLNADGYISTGQDINGYNMFAYCGNNPINRVDSNGELWHWAVLGVVGAVVNVATTFIAAKITDQEYSWADAGIAALSGLSNAIPYVGPLVSGTISGVYTGYTSYSKGANLKNSIISGTVSGLATTCSIGNLATIQGATLDIATNAVVDTVFGTGYNTLSSAITKSVTNTSKSNTTSVLSTVRRSNQTANTRIVNGTKIYINKNSTYVDSRYSNRIYCYVKLI